MNKKKGEISQWRLWPCLFHKNTVNTFFVIFQGELDLDGDENDGQFGRNHSHSFRKEVREFSLDNIQDFDEKVLHENEENTKEGREQNGDIKSWL